MTQPHQPPQPYGFPAPISAPPAKKSNAGKITLIIVAAVIALCGIGTVVSVLTAANSVEQATRIDDSPLVGIDPGTGTVGETTTPAADPADYPAVTAKDVQITVKVTDRQCFGDAGCNIEYKIDAGIDPAKLRSGIDWAVTYEISGVEGGPIVSTTTFYGDGTYDTDPGFAMTPSKDTKLTVKITDVDKIGI